MTTPVTTPVISSIDVRPNPILSGGVATLKADVKELPSDWQASGYTIQWYVRGASGPSSYSGDRSR